MSHLPPNKNNLTLVERAAAAASAHAHSEPYDVCKLIIEKPEKQQPGQKLLLGGITLLFWGVWSFLWAPVANTLGWAFGVYSFYEHLIVLRGWESVVNQLPIYAVVVQVMGGGLILWALLNWRRFRGKERRLSMRDVTHDDVAEWQTQPPAQIATWQKAQRLVVHYDAHGHLAEVESDHIRWHKPTAPLGGEDGRSNIAHIRGKR